MFTYVGYSVPRDSIQIKNYIVDKLKRGYGVIIGYGGHIVRVQSCDELGYVYDDPYGSYAIGTNQTKIWGLTNSSTDESGVGKDNIRKWSDFKSLVTNQDFIIEYYYENKN